MNPRRTVVLLALGLASAGCWILAGVQDRPLADVDASAVDGGGPSEDCGAADACGMNDAEAPKACTADASVIVEREIDQLASSAAYVYFAVSDAGIYRARTDGGAVASLSDSGTPVLEVVATAADAFWTTPLDVRHFSETDRTVAVTAAKPTGDGLGGELSGNGFVTYWIEKDGVHSAFCTAASSRTPRGVVVRPSDAGLVVNYFVAAATGYELAEMPVPSAVTTGEICEGAMSVSPTVAARAPFDLAKVKDGIIWIDNPSGPGGALYRYDLPTRSATKLAETRARIIAAAATDDTVFILSAGQLLRVSAAGGSDPCVVMDNLKDPSAVAVSRSGQVFVAERGRGRLWATATP